MRSASEKKQIFSSVYAQIAIVVASFLLTGVSSFLYTRNIERRHLLRDAETALTFTEARIIADLLESETFIGSYSETVRSMILRGDSADNISTYIKDITNYMLNNKNHIPGFIGVYGFFETLGRIYISGLDWIPPEGYTVNIQEHPWYAAAVAANGEIATAGPFVDAETRENIFTFTRWLFDDEGRSLGVIGLDVDLGKILKYTAELKLTKYGYGMLLDHQLQVIAHPYTFQIGIPLTDSLDVDLVKFAYEFENGLNIFEGKAKNFNNENAVVFFRKIKYGWYLGIVVPVREYYKSANNMVIFLVLLCGVFAAALYFMLHKITDAIKKSDLRTQQKSNFLATMSHEIRTPLNAILGMTEIQMQNTAHPPATSEAFIKINNSGNLLLSIINDILDLSKIESGKLELTPIKYEVASLINDVVQLNQIRFESKPIEFKLEIDENIPSILVGDELRIKQILNNLLSNAFKYTKRGSVTLGVGAECVGRGGGAVLVTLVFQVSDTGEGMTQQQITKLFDEYTRFNMEANRTTEGAGLGMTITRNLIELMYGKINVKSVIGEGTTVTIRLPQKTDGIGIRGIIGKEQADNLRQFQYGNAIKMKRSKITHEYMPYGRVLIVDDVETNLYVAKGLMAPYGLNIDLATSGFEAVDKIKEGNIYDIVFMDHMMPKMDGIEAAKLIREMGYTRPIVALTANALAGQAEMFLKNGFDGFISKPIDVRQLNVSLNRLIRDKQPAEIVEAANREKAEMDKKHGPGENQPVDTQLAEIFARDAEKSAAVLETCLQNNFQSESDLQLYVINVHAMKSALANIGKPELSASAYRLEQASREKDINVLSSETPGFLDELYAVIKEIKPKDEDYETSEETDDAIALLREKLIVIHDACAALDKKTAKNTLNELREKTWTHKTRELLNKIAEHLLHSEFDNAAALALEYIKNRE